MNGHPYFGEFTFFHMGGTGQFKPQEWDKTFPKSDKVGHSKVTFMNRYGIKDYDTAHNLTNKKHDYGRALLSWKESKNGKD